MSVPRGEPETDWKAAIAAERAKRGLPTPEPVVRVKEEKRAQGIVVSESWWRCAKCGDDFPASMFKAAGNAYPRKRVCNDCYNNRYGKRVTTTCTDCPKLIETRENVKRPRCRPCQKAHRQVQQDRKHERSKPSLCISCGDSSESVRMVGPNCQTCHIRQWRAETGLSERSAA